MLCPADFTFKCDCLWVPVFMKRILEISGVTTTLPLECRAFIKTSSQDKVLAHDEVIAAPVKLTVKVSDDAMVISDP